MSSMNSLLLSHVSHIDVEVAGLVVGCAPIRIQFHKLVLE